MRSATQPLAAGLPGAGGGAARRSAGTGRGRGRRRVAECLWRRGAERVLECAAGGRRHPAFWARWLWAILPAAEKV